MPANVQTYGPRIKDLVPSSGIFPIYLREALELSPCPAIYHVVGLLAFVSAVVCPRTQLVRTVKGRRREEDLTIWTFLVGPPNNGKSYSLKMCRKIGEEMLRGRLMAPIGSIQGLEEALRVVPEPLLYMNEAARFLRENRATWMRGDGAQFWCDVFDGELMDRSTQGADHDTESRKTGGRKVRISMAMAAATGSLLRALKPGDWEGGLMSRVMMISAGRGQASDDWFDWSDPVRLRLQAMLADIQDFSRKNAEVGFDPAAYQVFKGWFHGTEDAMRGINTIHADALARLTRHVRVICGVYAASCLTTTITVPMVRAAIALGDRARLCTLSLAIS